VETALRELLDNGTYQAGQLLPPQRELADEYGVSRHTIQRVLRKLAEEGLIEPRQGSGSKVLANPGGAPAQRLPGRSGRVSLLPFVNHAFEQDEVSLDVFSLTSETLLRHLQNQEERVVAAEIAPRRVRLRMLLPWEDEPLAYPRAVDPGDGRVRERWRAMVHSHIFQVEELFERMRGQGVDAVVEIRRFPMTPQFKLYVLNGTDMLFGPYEVVRRSIPVTGPTPDATETVDAVDVLGLGSTLTHHRRREAEDSHDALFFRSMNDWFESQWECWQDLALH
jgi:hypothetical protein